MKKILLTIITIALVILILVITLQLKPAKTPVVIGDETFTEDIGNTLEKSNLIHLESPQPGTMVSSPLTIKGEARGNWFFEASFPVVLTDWDGRIIGEGIAQAQGEWMTTEFVPFLASITFTADPAVYSDRGSLILRKDNPSGLPANDDALEIPVIISNEAGL